MKKTKQSSGIKKKSAKVEEVPEETNKNVAKTDSLDDEDQGFGGWLRYKLYCIKLYFHRFIDS